MRGDVVAGLCVAGLLLPEAVAYAGLAHLPVGHGLTAALVGLALYAVFGGSRFAIVSPTSSTATLAMAAVLSMGSLVPAGYGPGYVQAVMAMVLLSGVLLFVLGLARQGQLSSFVSRPVLKGFAFALAVSIVVKQLPDAMGFAVPGDVRADPFHVLLYTLTHASAWHLPTIAVALGAGALMLVLRRWSYVPASLLVMVLAIGADRLLGLQAMGIREIGAVAAPQWRLALPDLPMDAWLRAGELAFGLVMMVFAESWGSMRSMALTHGDALEPDRELLVLGGCNVVSALLQGMPVGAGFSATTANAAAGAVSRKAGMVALAAMLVVVLFALPSIEFLPRPVLAVAVISALLHALSLGPIQAVWRMGRDRILMVLAVLAVLFFGVLDGMLLAIGLSILAAMRRFSEPVVHELGALGQSRNYVDVNAQHGAVASPGLLILRPEEPLFFGSAERVVGQVMQRLRMQPGIHTVILSLEESADLDSTAVDCLLELRRYLQGLQIELLLARVKTTVRALLERCDPDGLGASSHMFWSVADAASGAGMAAPAEVSTQAAAPGVA